MKLSSFQGIFGKPVVLYFYPADGTPGCTKQAQAFKDSIAAFKKAGAEGNQFNPRSFPQRNNRNMQVLCLWRQYTDVAMNMCVFMHVCVLACMCACLHACGEIGERVHVCLRECGWEWGWGCGCGDS